MISAGDTITFANTVNSNILFKRNAATVWRWWYKDLSYVKLIRFFIHELYEKDEMELI